MVGSLRQAGGKKDFAAAKKQYGGMIDNGNRCHRDFAADENIERENSSDEMPFAGRLGSRVVNQPVGFSMNRIVHSDKFNSGTWSIRSI